MSQDQGLNAARLDRLQQALLLVVQRWDLPMNPEEIDRLAAIVVACDDDRPTVELLDDVKRELDEHQTDADAIRDAMTDGSEELRGERATLDTTEVGAAEGDEVPGLDNGHHRQEIAVAPGREVAGRVTVSGDVQAEVSTTGHLVSLSYDQRWTSHDRALLTTLRWAQAPEHTPAYAELDEPPVDVVEAEVLARYIVRLSFDDGFVGVIDLEPVLWGDVFRPLREDYEMFLQARVDDSGTVVWPGTDISPRWLRAHARPVRP